MGNSTRVRDHREPGHFWADNEIVDNFLPQIGAYGFAVYMLLARFANNKTAQCDPSVKTIAKTLSLSPPTVQKALQALEECGLISITERLRAESNRKVNETNIYTILAVEKTARGTQGDWVPKEIGYGVPNHVDQGTQGDWVGVPNHVGTNNTEKTQLTRERESAPAPAPKSEHPSIALYTSITGLVPPKYSAEMIVQMTDLAKWEKAIKDWLASGHKPTNVKGMTDWYNGKGKHQQNGQGAARPPTDVPLTVANSNKKILPVEERRRILNEVKVNDTS